MTLDKILSIGGKPGLYRLITQTRGGFVAESLLDQKRVTVGMRSNVSVLSEIAIYTLEEELPLREVFQKIQKKEDGKKTSIGHKEDKLKLEEYFFEVLPNYDEDRVYPSDIKKVIQWYNILHDNDITDFSAGDKTEDEEEKAATEKSDDTTEESKSSDKESSEMRSSGKKPSEKKSDDKKTAKKSPQSKSSGARNTVDKKSSPSKTSGKKTMQKNPAAKKK